LALGVLNLIVFVITSIGGARDGAKGGTAAAPCALALVSQVPSTGTVLKAIYHAKM